MQTSKERWSDQGNQCSNVDVAVDRMETQQTSTVEANVGNEMDIVREMCLAEAKQQAGDKLQKKASKKSQQALEGKANCMDEEIPRCNGKKCKKGRETCCMMCPCDHKRYCQLGLQQVALKQTMKESKAKMDRRTQEGVLEAMHIADGVFGRPSSKRKTRQQAIDTFSTEGTVKVGILPELEVAKKCKVDESVKVSDKEQKIMQVAEICGVELPYGDRSKNFQSGTFETCSTTWCREQYGTTKALLDGVAQTVLGLDMKDFVRIAMERLPAAQKEFAELYGEEKLQKKLGQSVIRMYKVAPKNVKATILEGLISNENISLKDVQEGLGVTRSQWNKAKEAIAETKSGNKQKAVHGVAMRMKVETVESFVDFCLRPDNIQDVAYGTRAIKNEDGTAFICPQWIRKNHRAKMIRAFKQEFQKAIIKMPSKTWMYKVMDWVASKDMVSLAGLDNTDVAGKNAMIETAVLAEKVMIALGDSMPPDLRGKVGELRKDMELCKSVLRQHLEDSAHSNSHVSSHCLNHGLNSTEGFSCSHDHTECEMCVKPFAALALVDLLITKVQDTRRQKIFKREHELLLRSVVLFMGHVMRSVVQRPMQDATLESMPDGTRLLVVDWAMKWLALYHREQQSAFYAKAGLNWHQVCVIDKNGKTGGITQLLPEAKQTSWQVFNLFVHAVNDLKTTDPTVTGVIGQSDNAGCYHSLDLMLRLGLAGASGEMLVKVLEWLYSEAQDGKDVADRFIGTKKGQVKLWVKEGNDAVTAEDLCKALSEMKSLPGDHKTVVIEPAPADAEVPIPLKGGKGSKAKHFGLYHQIQFVYDPVTGAFLGLNVREQFNFGPYTFLELEKLVQMKKIEKVKSWVPPAVVRTQAAHGAASANTAKTTGTKKELGIFAKTQTKAHLMRETVLTESSDEGGALEEKGVDSSLDNNSGEDSDWTSSDIDSESTDLDIEDMLPFHCDACGRIFQSEIWFQRHMAKGVHRKRAVGMKSFVLKRMQFHVAQSKQVTSMHFKKNKMDEEGDPIPEAPALEGYAAEGNPFRQGWARKQKRQRGVACLPEVKKFLLKCFLEAYDKHGEVDRSKLVSKKKAFQRLEVEIEKNSWGAEAKRTEAQIGAHYSQFQKLIHGKSRNAAAQQAFQGDFGAFLDDSGSDAEP